MNRRHTYQILRIANLGIRDLIYLNRKSINVLFMQTQTESFFELYLMVL